jgi:hypothetical protein
LHLRSKRITLALEDTVTLLLELDSTEERQLRDSARQAGVSLEEYVRRCVGMTPKEPEWKAKLEAAQKIMAEAFEQSGITDDELSEIVEAEVKVYRKERADAERKRDEQQN